MSGPGVPAVTEQVDSKARPRFGGFWSRVLPFQAPVVTVLAGLAALIVAILPHLNALGGGIIPVLQAVVPVMALAGVAMGIVLMVFRRTRLPGLIVVLGALAGGLPTLVPSEAGADPQAEQLTVLSLNVQVGNASSTELTELILERQTDVVVLVEADEYFLEGLMSPEVAAALPYRSGAATPGGASGTVILSRHRLVAERDIPAPANVVTFDQPVVRVDHPELGMFRVAAIHPFPPVAGGTDWKAGLSAIKDWQGNNTDLPLIMAGDFNASYAHPVFRQIAKTFVNTAVVAGQVPQPTWPATGRIPAFAAIDHVLVRGLTPVQWERISITGTDHHGILTSVTK